MPVHERTWGESKARLSAWRTRARKTHTYTHTGTCARARARSHAHKRKPARIRTHARTHARTRNHAHRRTRARTHAPLPLHVTHRPVWLPALSRCLLLCPCTFCVRAISDLYVRKACHRPPARPSKPSGPAGGGLPGAAVSVSACVIVSSPACASLCPSVFMSVCLYVCR